MFDPKLTKENALEDIADPGSVMGSSRMDAEIVALDRLIEDTRIKSFANAEGYMQNFPALKQLLNQFIRKFATLKIVEFFKQNFHIYANVGNLQRRFENDIRHVLVTFLLESISNATSQSDNVNVSLHISPKGVLLDVEQSAGTGFDSAFLLDLRMRAVEVYARLSAGTPIQSLVEEARRSWRKAIGYVPPDIQPEDEDMAYRGNGTGNALINNFVRTNFVSDASGDHAITLHTAEQLRYVDRFQQGDRSVIPHLYASRGTVQEVPQARNEDPNTQAIDDLFSGGFNF